MRTNDIFEYLYPYQNPKLIPFAKIDDNSAFEDIGFKAGSSSHFLTKMALHLSGFKNFENHLKENLEYILRTTNIRLPNIHSPVISATLSILDDPNCNDSVSRAVKLILAVRQFYIDLKEGKIEQDRYGGDFLEMGLYANLFATNVVVQDKQAYLNKSSDFSKINIISNGKYYILDIGEIEKTIDQSALINTISKIKKDSFKSFEDNETSPGLITAASTQTQFEAIKILLRDKNSFEEYNVLKNILFTICLDSEVFPKSNEETVFYAHNKNHKNRWYYSSLQAVIFGNGKTALICNFAAYLDGNIMMRSASEIYKRSILNYPFSEKQEYSYRKLNLKFPIELKSKILEDIDSVSDNQQASFTINDVGVRCFKKFDLEPVPAFIIALQKTMLDFTQKMVNVYQFITMSKYRYMTLLKENVSTKTVFDCVSQLENTEKTDDQKFELIRNAIDSQKDKLRKKRTRLSLDYIFKIYLCSISGIRKKYALAISQFFSLIQGRTKLFIEPSYDVMVSHPAIFEDVPIIGRSGAKLPYVKYMGLHYQIYDDKINITLMPSTEFSVPNKEFIAKLESNLKKLLEISENAINSGSHKFSTKEANNHE
ncbi:MAG: choline/carnitine O-acyltransferase [Calditrichae bacterium]|nr:choline/carnitine O-acyltransferase [Calditrichia bacterium]